MVEDIFTFDGHTKDDFFELKRSKENLDKEKEAMERNKFLLEVDDKVSRSKEHVLEAKTQPWMLNQKTLSFVVNSN